MRFALGKYSLMLMLLFSYSSFACDVSLFYVFIRAAKLTPNEISKDIVTATGLRPSQLSYTNIKPLTGRKLNPKEKNLREESEVMDSYALTEGVNSLAGSAKLFFRYKEAGIWKPHSRLWQSNYRAEVLAYELSELWGFNLVPVTIPYKRHLATGSLQEYVIARDLVKTNQNDLKLQSLFDFLIENTDRHSGNYLTGNGGRVWSIDHGISFTGMRSAEYRSFGERLTEITDYLEFDHAEEIISKIKASLESDVFVKEIESYLGITDTKKLIQRMKILVYYDDALGAGEDIPGAFKYIYDQNDIDDYGLSVLYDAIIFSNHLIDDFPAFLARIRLDRRAGKMVEEIQTGNGSNFHNRYPEDNQFDSNAWLPPNFGGN